MAGNMKDFLLYGYKRAESSFYNGHKAEEMHRRREDERNLAI